MLKIFDTHAHYDSERFDKDREELLQDLTTNQQVGRIVNIACDEASCRKNLEFVKDYDFMYGSVGFHPDEVGDLNEDLINWMKEEALNEEKIVAVGEIGLDYYWNKEARDIQIYWLEAQLAMATELNLPVVIHSREAAKDTLEVIKANGGANRMMDIHCFSYSVEMAREYLNMGHYLGIGGVVTFNNGKKLKEVVEYMPLDRILLETDAPYLTPVPFRSKRNDSGKIHYVVDEIARLKQISTDEVLEQTWKNACTFYNVEP
ncbi:putative deoxyribonuclease YcfH [Lachnospiraceae bacterium TWA4]|nr:putative deoxyribonuclease YcfH [Lachnospiraceae bacterium TWA4]